MAPPSTKKGTKNFSAANKKQLSMRNDSVSTSAVLHGAAPAADKGIRMPFKRRQKAPSAAQLRKAGLPQPTKVKLDSKAFKALQSKWYDKLEADGFDDIERSQHGATKGLNADYMRGGTFRGRTWSPERAQFYRLLQNYVTHYRPVCKQERFVMLRLNDGWTYRKILAKCKAKYKLKRSLYWFYYYVQDLVAKMVAWNGTSEHGLLNPANADTWATDALLSDLSGQAGVHEAPNGLKLDQGWWLENMAEWWRSKGGH